MATSGSKVSIVCVNGCCYGRSSEKNEYKSNGNFYKICGERFWALISGYSNLYVELIEPLGKEAEENNKLFKESYGKLINKLTKEFLEDFCKDDGSINWRKLIIFNSSVLPMIKKVPVKIIKK